MSSERAGVHTSGPEGLAEYYRASTGWEMAEGHAVTDAFLAGYRAGTPTRGALNREKARDVLAGHSFPLQRGTTIESALDRLEACVVADPRLARIEAFARDAIDSRGGEWDERAQVYADEVLAILRGNE